MSQIATLFACIFLATGIAVAEINTSELPVETVRAFPELRVRRPVVIGHAGDGSNRLFIATQQGVVHFVDPNDTSVEETTKFLDIEDKVVYHDRKNEEGLLGMAFHPKFKENGYFYLYYTSKEEPLLSVISRFSVSKDDPNKADPDSEFELMRIKQPYWNHNGGTIEFGPDGYLYIGLGDGGAFNDPHMNGQNIQTLLGSILRIDVDKKGEKTNYAIPADNPFAGMPRLARGEIFAYGFRNVWRFSFDKATGKMWAADVGQDIWEEINIVTKGGNYGWDLREATHKFGPTGAEKRDDLIEPIFEYHHDIGKSITGGNVYRGSKVPELQGYYLYADYVTNKIWALKYDADAGKVTENRSISTKDQIPVITFGEDESGEVYCSDAFGRIYRFAAKK